jgi:DNA-directed RNA polymerase specialized sigma24 family protein
MAKKQGKYYVKNKEMLEALRELQKTGVIGEDLHLMFYKMAQSIGTKPRFSGYTWIEDMISDAYLKCCVKAHKFDVSRTNPFGYFTTVIIHHFWDALAGENKQKNIKEKLRDDQISQIYHRYGIQFKVGTGGKNE